MLVRQVPGSVQLYRVVVYSTAVLLGVGKGDYRTIGIKKIIKWYRRPQKYKNTTVGRKRKNEDKAQTIVANPQAKKKWR
jgi:hypothetical protein